jgi:2-polyprenyl-6-hydroxyphenyl methylase/3-demethylubiquinone-9 3-methyltransferase
MRDATVSQREVDFYTRLANSWWDRAGPFWPLHRLNELRTAYIRQRLCAHFDRDPGARAPLEGLRVLDVGCGGGILSEAMAGLGADVTGIDVVEKNIGVARLHASQQALTIDYRLCPIADVVAAGHRYDVVLNMEVVEHVADVPAFMRDCCAAVDDNGVMFVATINRTWKAWLFAIVGAEYVLGWLPKGTHQWRNFQKPEEIAACLAAGGLQVADTTGVMVSPLDRTLHRTSSTRVNFMLMARR